MDLHTLKDAAGVALRRVGQWMHAGCRRVIDGCWSAAVRAAQGVSRWMWRTSGPALRRVDAGTQPVRQAAADAYATLGDKVETSWWRWFSSRGAHQRRNITVPPVLSQAWERVSDHILMLLGGLAVRFEFYREYTLAPLLTRAGERLGVVGRVLGAIASSCVAGISYVISPLVRWCTRRAEAARRGSERTRERWEKFYNDTLQPLAQRAAEVVPESTRRAAADKLSHVGGAAKEAAIDSRDGVILTLAVLAAAGLVWYRTVGPPPAPMTPAEQARAAAFTSRGAATLAPEGERPGGVFNISK
jgi:hypothetical protein